MSNLARLGLNDPVAASSPNSSSGEISAQEKNVAGAGKVPDGELYAHRAVIAERARQEAGARRPLRVSLSRIVGAAFGTLAVAALAGVLIFAVPTLFEPKIDNPYLDLGTQKYDPAGLGGRLTAEWTGSAEYKLTINPLDPAQIPAFRAMIANPRHAITFTVRLKDSTGEVACQKNIVIPGTQESSEPASQSHAPAGGAAQAGDTIHDVAGKSGQIAEVDFAGPLPCSVDSFQQIVAWDFTTDFPTLSAQKKWKKPEETATEEANKMQVDSAPAPLTFANYSFVKSLPIPIEADDVIVRDNQMKGVLATVGGHSFYVGTDVLDNPSLDWQLFPAEVHYRCDRSALCTVTRLDSNSLLHAHLLK